MPTVNASGSEEGDSPDEVKVFKYEGDANESEKSSSENLTEDKSSLITETEEGKSNNGASSSTYNSPKVDSGGRIPDAALGLFGASTWGADRLGYTISPFPYYTNGSTAMPKDLGAHGSSILSLYNGQTHLGQPPPAHMGISPYQLDTKAGLRPPMYPFAGAGQYPYSLPADFTAQMATAWLAPGSLMHPHPGLSSPLPHPLVSSPKIDIGNSSHENHRHHSLNDHKSNHSEKSTMLEAKNGGDKKPHIKKPLNAFMLYMKEMRAKVVAECTLKESAAINQILGRKWHALSKDEQSKYYEMARRERQVHMQLHPTWNARDNYGMMKKKKRKKEKTMDGGTHRTLAEKAERARGKLDWHALTRDEQAKYYEMARKERQLHMQMYPGWSSRQNYSQGKKKKRNRDKTHDGANMKKCRARFGVEQQTQWCKPCRRKKKCIRYHDDGDEHMDRPPGSTESMEDSMMPESDSDAEYDMNPSLITSISNSSLDPLACSPSSNLLLSPGPSLASPCGPPSMLIPSPASLSSPMTPGEASRDLHGFEQRPHKAPVGNNPRDINNPLSVNQLTGQCATSNSDNNECPSMVRVT